ncbi:MAG: ATP-dependent Lon protease [Cyanobacteriota bacterium erpe_2018_sw_21hr_WHONDRS-SW48-000092_B_bin.40]|jgi:ATP-dependent Lon protease|nr:ATP-dependent Lon protease [Cyanobacteriota bacterium erpe_2018_sw_21hr_WHONDRS-SW48-000092_B_bin.40]
MNALDLKINEHFPGVVVRKDLVKTVKGNAIVPTYVLEYLLGQYCATSDEATINSGIETVKEVLRKHYVHRNEAGLIKSVIKEKGRHKIIDKISVSLNDKSDAYEASFSNLGIKKVIVDSETVKKNPKLLVSGVWCLADMEYMFTEDKNASSWILNTLKPIQLSNFDFDSYLKSREAFTTDEWIDLLIQSIGFNPSLFGRRSKLLQLVRLIPYCERNFNLIELGPKGTGKSHIFSDFSPHGILISGGEVSVPKLFVNNSSGKIGLVGYWDVIAFDEFAGKSKRIDRALVDIMKNYMANKSFSRGVETLGGEASMVFVGNTQHNLPYMLKNSDLFDELPESYYDSAFIDRLHFYAPGWEVDIIRGEMFSEGFGFVVDYLAEILRTLRNHDYSNAYADHFTLSSDMSTRDRDGINKTFSGLMKILYPEGKASPEQMEELLRFAIEGRKRVKDQLMRIDKTFQQVRFAYKTRENQEVLPRTLEEEEYPLLYGTKSQTEDSPSASESAPSTPVQIPAAPQTAAVAEQAFSIATQMAPAKTNGSAEATAAAEAPLKEGHLTVQENQKGISFDSLFGPYLKGASKIVVTDPYIRVLHQARNLMDLLESIAKLKPDEDEVEVELITGEEEVKRLQQLEYLEKIRDAANAVGVKFSWKFDSTIHARHIVTDNGWKILLDRGLDVFQYVDNNTFSLASRMQKYRPCKAFEVTYIRNASSRPTSDSVAKPKEKAKSTREPVYQKDMQA